MTTDLPIGVSDSDELVLVYNAWKIEPPFTGVHIVISFNRNAPLFWAPVDECSGLFHMNHKAVMEILTRQKYEQDYGRPAPPPNTREVYREGKLLRFYPRNNEQRHYYRLDRRREAAILELARLRARNSPSKQESTC